MNRILAIRHQRGAVLIVSLILLVVIMIISLSSMRNIAFEERMASNAYDRSLAFQATEAALRAGEAAAQFQADALNSGFSGTSKGEYDDADDTCGLSPCLNGLCSQPDKNCPVRWKDASFTGWVNATGLGLTSLTVVPQYFVEFLGRHFPCDDVEQDRSRWICKLYRVTARSHDATANRSMVILQSIYRTE